MSKLEEISETPNAKRQLKGVNFDFTASHLAYTDASQGGAASLLNDPVLLKANDISDLTSEQLEIISKIKENSTPLNKDNSVNIDEGSPQVDEEASLPSEDGGLPKTNDNNSLEKDNTMSEIAEIQEQLNAVKQELRVTKAVNLVTPLGLEDEQVVTFSKALSTLPEDEAVAVVAIFKSVKEAAEEELKKAQEENESEEENTLAKNLQEESGNEEESEELTFVQKVQKAQDEQEGDK